jgi:hypothetical protein
MYIARRTIHLATYDNECDAKEAFDKLNAMRADAEEKYLNSLIDIANALKKEARQLKSITTIDNKTVYKSFEDRAVEAARQLSIKREIDVAYGGDEAAYNRDMREIEESSRAAYAKCYNDNLQSKRNCCNDHDTRHRELRLLLARYAKRSMKTGLWHRPLVQYCMSVIYDLNSSIEAINRIGAYVESTYGEKCIDEAIKDVMTEYERTDDDKKIWDLGDVDKFEWPFNEDNWYTGELYS